MVMVRAMVFGICLVTLISACLFPGVGGLSECLFFSNSLSPQFSHYGVLV